MCQKKKKKKKKGKQELNKWKKEKNTERKDEKGQEWRKTDWIDVWKKVWKIEERKNREAWIIYWLINSFKTKE